MHGQKNIKLLKTTSPGAFLTCLAVKHIIHAVGKIRNSVYTHNSLNDLTATTCCPTSYSHTCYHQNCPKTCRLFPLHHPTSLSKQGKVLTRKWPLLWDGNTQRCMTLHPYCTKQFNKHCVHAFPLPMPS